MGFSQYFSKKELVHDDATWDVFLKDVKKVASRFDLCIPNSIHFIKDEDTPISRDIHIKIGDGMGNGNAPEFDDKHIWFNGVGEDSHETLSISKDDSWRINPEDNRMYDYYKGMWGDKKEIFGFTKTNHKPYEILVLATLVLYKHHFKDKVDVFGDAGREGFQEGVNLVNETLGTSINVDDIYGE